jgi:hypothetical protein
MKMTRIIITAIGCITAALALGQNPVTYSGTISEKVEIRFPDSNLKFIEIYNPPRKYKMVLMPAIIKFTFNGKERTFHGVKPAYKDENNSLVFLVRENEKSPIWMLLISPDGEKLWAEIDEPMKVMRGHYLK